LFNLRELEKRIVQEAQEAFQKKRPLSIVLVDIDGFGETNQKYGYPAGDSILKQFARGLVEGSRRKDPFFRYRSGDEFAVLALNQGRDDARAFAERMRREAESSEFEIWDTEQKHHFLKITISAGVAELKFPAGASPDLDEAVHHLEANAQAALGDAKRHKNRVMAFNPASLAAKPA
jgi:two-component system cell cycle response regulator